MIVSLQAERDRKAEEAFREYSELAQRAQATLNVNDALAAGRAWGRFMRLYEDRPASSDVVNFPGARHARA
jgi:hypothetical protein